MAEHSSLLFARNVLALLELLVDDAGALHLDFEDEIVQGACIVRAGEIVNPAAKAAVAAEQAKPDAAVDATSGIGGGGPRA
jgi:NAD(P) transhydrogenase subunit alpha